MSDLESRVETLELHVKNLAESIAAFTEAVKKNLEYINAKMQTKKTRRSHERGRVPA
jgi:chaperonin cofactor prefoldin